MKGPFKKFRKKRCEGCKHLFHKGNIFACQNEIGCIQPVKLICLRRERENERHNEDNK